MTAPFISPKVAAPPLLSKRFLDTLNLNTLLHIIKRYGIQELTLYDPKCTLAHRLKDIIYRLKFLRVVTENAQLYDRYNEECFDTFGCRAAVTHALPCIENGLIFAADALPPCSHIHNTFIIGAGGFCADTESVFLPEVQKLCPDGISKTDFFTLLATVNNYEPLLLAVPRKLKMNGVTVDIENLPIK